MVQWIMYSPGTQEMGVLCPALLSCCCVALDTSLFSLLPLVHLVSACKLSWAGAVSYCVSERHLAQWVPDSGWGTSVNTTNNKYREVGCFKSIGACCCFAPTQFLEHCFPILNLTAPDKRLVTSKSNPDYSTGKCPEQKTKNPCIPWYCEE